MTPAQERANIVDLILDAYHTTRIDGVSAVSHILSKPYVQHAFDELERRKSAHAPTVDRDEVVDTAIGFMRHDGLCGIVGGYGRCTCGRDQAESALRAAITKAKGQP